MVASNIVHSETLDQPALAAAMDLNAARTADSFDKFCRETQRLLEQLRVCCECGRGRGVVGLSSRRQADPGFPQAWKTACAQAGCSGRIPHDFRRTAVRNLERAGVPRSIAMQITGHQTEAVYRRYDIVDEADLSEGLRRLARCGHTFGHNPVSEAASGTHPIRASH